MENQQSVNPKIIELSEGILSQFLQLSHKEQSEIFKIVQKKLIENRRSLNESMTKELECFATDVKSHSDGTDFMSAAV